MLYSRASGTTNRANVSYRAHVNSKELCVIIRIENALGWRMTEVSMPELELESELDSVLELELKSELEPVADRTLELKPSPKPKSEADLATSMNDDSKSTG